MQLWSFICIVKLKAADTMLSVPASMKTNQKYKSSKSQMHKKKESKCLMKSHTKSLKD